MNRNSAHAQQPDDHRRSGHDTIELPANYAPRADLMSALRVAASALGRHRAVVTADEYHEFFEWLNSLTEGEKGFLVVGLLTICSACLDPDIDADFMLQQEVDLPAPSEPIAMCDAVNGDWVQLVHPETGNRSCRRVTRVQLSRSGIDVTLSFAGAEPITAPRDTVIVRTVRAGFEPESHP